MASRNLTHNRRRRTRPSIARLAKVTAGRTAYSQALGSFDQASILVTLSEKVTIRVAVHDEPLRGKDTAAFLFGVLTQELAPFQLTREIVEHNTSVVLFETSLRGRKAHGLNVVELQPDRAPCERSKPAEWSMPGHYRGPTLRN
jgi:hypothetical protein